MTNTHHTPTRVRTNAVRLIRLAAAALDEQAETLEAGADPTAARAELCYADGLVAQARLLLRMEVAKP